MVSTVIQVSGGPSSKFLNYVALTVAPNSVCEGLYNDYNGTTEVRSVRACFEVDVHD